MHHWPTSSHPIMNGIRFECLGDVRFSISDPPSFAVHNLPITDRASVTWTALQFPKPWDISRSPANALSMPAMICLQPNLQLLAGLPPFLWAFFCFTGLELTSFIHLACTFSFSEADLTRELSDGRNYAMFSLYHDLVQLLEHGR